jgi:hypothetical protein
MKKIVVDLYSLPLLAMDKIPTTVCLFIVELVLRASPKASSSHRLASLNHKTGDQAVETRIVVFQLDRVLESAGPF